MAAAARDASEARLPARASKRELTHAGWEFVAVDGCISGSDELERLEAALQQPRSLPEMLFGSNSLRVRHLASGTEV